MRAVIRAGFVLLLSAYCLAMTLPDIALPWHPFSTFGFSANPGSGLVTGVDSEAAASGLRRGDTIDRHSLSPVAQRQLLRASPVSPPGTTVRVPLTSGRVVMLRSHPFARSALDNASDVALMIAYLVMVAIASILVLIRPAPATWAFYLTVTAISFNPAQLTIEYWPLDARSVIGVSIAIIVTTGNAAALSFALRFPNAEPSRGARIFERLVLFGVTALAILIGYVGAAGVPWGRDFNQVVNPLLYWSSVISAAIILLTRYVNAGPEMRSRLQWIVASFAVAFIPAGINKVVQGAGFFLPIWIINTAMLFQVVAPIAVAYTVFKHRLFDIRLIFSRAMLYAVLTSIMVALLAILDWAIGRWLAESRFALAAELVLAVGIGVLLTAMHRRIEQLLNNVIFRSQTLALQALRRFSQETDLIADPHFLLLQTGEVLRTRLECDYIAIYTADGSSYALVTQMAQPVPALLAAHDLAVLRLRRWHEPFECEEPNHALAGALLLPMTARGQLVGFIACGPKHDRTHYLPDEVVTLTTLAHRTGSAYALLTFAAQPFDSAPSALISS